MTGSEGSYPNPGSRLPAGRFQRWPELLVGGLVLAVLGGLGGLLLNERLKPEKPVSDQASQVIPSVIPASPGAVKVQEPPAKETANNASSAAQGGAETSKIPAPPPAPPVAKIPPPVLPEPEPLPASAQPISAQPEATPTATTLPQATQTQATQAQAAQPETTPTQQAQTQGAPPSANQTQATTPQPVETPAPQRAQEQTPASPAATVTPRAGGAVTTSAQRTPLRSDYRVMLGTFTNRGNLQSATAAVSALGYTVYAIDLGNQYVAQVGPFADEATGQQALADIQRVYGRAALYAPRGQQLETPQGTVPEAVPATPETSAQPEEQLPTAQATPQAEAPAAPTEPEPVRPAPSGPTYLQVGAFNNPEGAQRFVDQLRAQGFNPSVNAPAQGKVTVLLGPFTGDALTTTEQRLNAAGIDSFRLR